MAYRFAPASNPFLDISGGALVGDNLRNTSSGGWTAAAGLKRASTGAWMCVNMLHNNAGTELLFMLEFNPGNQMAGDDLGASWVSTFTSTVTTDMIVAISWDGTDNVANNMRWSFWDATNGWRHELDTLNTGQLATPTQATDRFRMGNNLALSDDFNGDLYVWGVKLSPSSEAEIEALSVGSGGYATWQTRFGGADSILHRFDDISALTDQTGGGANETARSAAGITLVSDPVGFYGAAAATNPPTKRKPRTRGLFLR
jgi:hypothetical protein